MGQEELEGNSAQLEGIQEFAIDAGCRNKSIINLIVTNRDAGSIAHISINGAAVISSSGKCSLHLKLDTVAIVVSTIMFNNHRPLLNRRKDTCCNSRNHKIDI